MQYKDIETFLELVRTRNITKTAEHLYLSQPTVSNRLKNLEDELGSQLIVRSKGHRMVQLTHQGELFIPVAERWKNLFEETELLKKVSLSTLRLAANESAYYEILAPFLRYFLHVYPHIKAAIQICDSEQVYDMLEKNLIDYGLAAYESSRPEVLLECVATQALCVIQYAENPQPGRTISPSQLDPAKEIRFTGGFFSSMRLWREKWFGPNYDCRIELNTSRGIVPFLEHTDYWALTPLDTAEVLAKKISLQIYHLEDAPEPRKIYLLKKHSNYQSSLEVRRLFEKELKAFLKAGRQKPNV